MQRIIVTMMFIVLGITGPLLAQQTTGNISRPRGRRAGRGGSWRHGHREEPVRPASPAAKSSDAEGVYRLTALPVGIYDLTAELQGFSKVREQGRSSSTSARRSTST